MTISAGGNFGAMYCRSSDLRKDALVRMTDGGIDSYDRPATTPCRR
jgi:hypothetical protein